MRTIEKLYNMLNERLSGWTVTMNDNNSINVESVNIKIETEEQPAAIGSVGQPSVAGMHKICNVSWVNQDEDLGSYILGLLQSL